MGSLLYNNQRQSDSHIHSIESLSSKHNAQKKRQEKDGEAAPDGKRTGVALAQLHQVPSLPHGAREQDAIVRALSFRGHAARAVVHVRGPYLLVPYLDVLAGEAPERDDGQKAE